MPIPATEATTAVSTEVIIIGAGPTGLALANQLQRFGIRYQIYDSKPGLTDLSKALVVHARTLEIYEQLELAQAAVEQGRQVKDWVMLHQGRVAAHLNFDKMGAGQSPFPFVLIYEQSKNEALLYENLEPQREASAKTSPDNPPKVHWEHRFVSLLQNSPLKPNPSAHSSHEVQQAAAVVAEIENASGHRFQVRGEYLVACDGASSTVRQALNMEFAGSTLPRYFYVADVKMPIDVPDATISVSFDEQSFALLAPMVGQHHWRVIGNLPELSTEAELDTLTFEDILPTVEKVLGQTLHCEATYWFSTYRVHTRHTAHFQQERCFLAGDAAHVHTPAGGQGMNTGIQDAYNLGWKLWLALRYGATPAFLASYDDERLANAKYLLRSTDQAFQWMVGEHRGVRWLRDHVLPGLAHGVTLFPPARELIFPLLSQIGIHYRESPLSQPTLLEEFPVKPGDRLPYFEVEGKSIYQRLKAPCFHLLILYDGESDLEPLYAEIESLSLLQPLICPLYPFLVDRFESMSSTYLLVRPDLHVACIADITDLESLKIFFGRWLNPLMLS